MASKALIYIVDDEPLQRELLADHLGNMPAYEIHSFGTGEECLAAIKFASRLSFSSITT